MIDEIGKMELLVPAFRELVLACLDNSCLLVATVMFAPHPFAERIKARQDVELITIGLSNRERLSEELARWMVEPAGARRNG